MQLKRCTECGNNILLDDGDTDCYYCTAAISTLECHLPASKRAAVANWLGMMIRVNEGAAAAGWMTSEWGELHSAGMIKLGLMLGIPIVEIKAAYDQVKAAKDKEQWIKHMTNV